MLVQLKYIIIIVKLMIFMLSFHNTSMNRRVVFWNVYKYAEVTRIFLWNWSHDKIIHTYVSVFMYKFDIYNYNTSIVYNAIAHSYVDKLFNLLITFTYCLCSWIGIQMSPLWPYENQSTKKHFSSAWIVSY